MLRERNIKHFRTHFGTAHLTHWQVPKENYDEPQLESITFWQKIRIIDIKANKKSFWQPENETSKYIFFFVQYFQSKIRAGFRILWKLQMEWSEIWLRSITPPSSPLAAACWWAPLQNHQKGIIQESPRNHQGITKQPSMIHHGIIIRVFSFAFLSDLSNSQTFLRLNWCNSGWWR